MFITSDATNSLKTSVSNGKSAVASAITDKGVSTSATASFDTMASNIRSIPVTTGYTRVSSYSAESNGGVGTSFGIESCSIYGNIMTCIAYGYVNGYRFSMKETIYLAWLTLYLESL